MYAFGKPGLDEDYLSSPIVNKYRIEPQLQTRWPRRQANWAFNWWVDIVVQLSRYILIRFPNPPTSSQVRRGPCLIYANNLILYVKHDFFNTRIQPTTKFFLLYLIFNIFCLRQRSYRDIKLNDLCHYFCQKILLECI